ncbi:zinc finger protein [Loa loa]|uniref:Zinc finger protein n=1 Tax=Loa loa TaxID=7209 RepID=A0A1S0TPI3_LOALO|nr:zinc finger protein [Loa loa]EFO17257.1 zinc finger protein [Loa loa]
MRSHTGKKLHSCPICKENFSRLHYKEDRMRTHTVRSHTAVPHTIKVSHLSAMKKHMRTHTGKSMSLTASLTVVRTIDSHMKVRGSYSSQILMKDQTNCVHGRNGDRQGIKRQVTGCTRSRSPNPAWKRYRNCSLETDPRDDSLVR